MEDAPPGTRLIWAGTESGDYPVFLGRGLIESGFFAPLEGRRFVVTDENVARVQRVEGVPGAGAASSEAATDDADSRARSAGLPSRGPPGSAKATAATRS